MDTRLPAGILLNLPPTAYLRVFSPLRAFDDTDQLLIREQPPRSRQAFESEARTALLSRVTRAVTDPFPHETTESYRVLHARTPDGTASFWCPDQLPLRAGSSAGILEENIPTVLTEAILPDAAVEAHAERLQEQGMWLDDELVFTQEAVWGIPLAWFSLFDEDEPVEIDDVDELLTSARIHTTLTLALERAHRTATLLAQAADELPLVDELVNLMDWLEDFHPDSMVELDYGLLARLVWPDESVGDLHAGVEALAEGDVTTAAAAHHRLVRRWASIRMLGRAG
ncbi:MAG: hypothetical protein ACTIJJ_03615 [Galactobacter sp.]|uniref:hypothetical protein n=1 Tax=Galactobacter sp. TaxID=2676125 RepID=UPI0025BCEF4A|nr:hypothetical protein [Galactobacter sp.]